MRGKQLEELERRAQYAADAEMKRGRSEAIMREREIALQKVREPVFHSVHTHCQCILYDYV